MRSLKQKPQMTSTEFSAALREAGFSVEYGRIVDVSGNCPGLATLPSFNNGAVNRNATLSKELWGREAEIQRRRVSADLLISERCPTRVSDLHPEHDLFSTADIGDDRPPLGKPVHRQRGELPD